MIKRLIVRNFQSHRNTTVDFCPGVNVIAGRSQAGKTALLRALRWVISNRPRGLRFRSFFAGKEPTEVSLELQEGINVTLRKGDKESVYCLGKGSGVEEFRGFSDKVPDTIERTVNLSDINIQSQLEEPFLVLSSPGEVARTINRITRLEKVDEWTKRLTSRINRTSHEAELLREEVKVLEKKLQGYEGLDRLGDMIDRGIGLEDQVVELQARKEELEKLRKSLERVDRAIEVLREVDGLEELFNEVERIDEEIEHGIVLRKLFGRLILLKEVIINCRESLERVEKGLDEIEDLGQAVEKEKELGEELERLVDIEQRLSAARRDHEKVKKEYVEVLYEEGRCPFCFSSISEDRLKELVEEL